MSARVTLPTDVKRGKPVRAVALAASLFPSSIQSSLSPFNP